MVSDTPLLCGMEVAAEQPENLCNEVQVNLKRLKIVRPAAM